MDSYNHQIVFNGVVVDIEQMEVEIRPGSRYLYQVIRHPGGAGVLPVHDDGTVTLIRQLRPAVALNLLEIPAGRLDPQESPEICAARELHEETGYMAGNLVSLGYIHSSPGVFDEVIHLFAATTLVAGAAEPEADEEIELVRIPFEEAVAMASSGELTDAKTITAIFRWEQVWRRKVI